MDNLNKFKSAFVSLMKNKKGTTSVKGGIVMLIGLLIFLVMLVSLAPSFFNYTTLGGPAWFDTLLPVMTAGILALAVWKFA